MTETTSAYYDSKGIHLHDIFSMNIMIEQSMNMRTDTKFVPENDCLQSFL